jgi:hypothetical protein
VIKKRSSANSAEAKRWDVSDLIFISAFGEQDHREVAFAHFHKDPETTDLPVLRVLGWHGEDTHLKSAAVARTLKSRLSWPENEADQESWRQQWRSAFKHRPGHTINTAKELATAMAGFAKRIRNAARDVLPYESETGRLRKLYKGFQDALIHDLTEDDFTTYYAETICYGLFTVAVSKTELSDGKYGTAIAVDDVAHFVPVTNPFLKEMLWSFLEAGGRNKELNFDDLGINEIVSFFNSSETDLPAVIRDFGSKRPGEDPVIHLYEDFLKQFDAELRKKRGVYYTPKPVVSYIVRSVHELLQSELGIEDGLASTVTWGDMQLKNRALKLPPLTDLPGEERTISPDEPFVQILDPATGTATFLVEVIAQVAVTLKSKWGAELGLKIPVNREAIAAWQDTKILAKWNEYVPLHLLPRLHGYELMMAPYAIAHMKIGLKLAETGYRFETEERARIYLTNALEPWIQQLPLIGLEALAKEAAAVNEIKRHTRFTVVVGNPPYTVMSANLSDRARSMIDEYRHVNGERIEEKSMLRLEMHLQKDEIKFFRLGQILIELAGYGVLGCITNHSFLANPTLRGMRQSLCKTFSKIWCYDLHGDSKKKDDAPSIVADKNVFDIQQGVAIALAALVTLEKAPGLVGHADLFGSRNSKFRCLSDGVFSHTNWDNLEPSSPLYLFVPQDATLRDEYDRAFGLLEIMPFNSCGIVSGREGLNYDFDKLPLEERIAIFCDLRHSDDWIRARFDVRDAGGYELSKRRRMIVGKDPASFTRRIEIKPFDTRWVAYTRGVLTSDQSNVMSHMLDVRNVGLITTRQTKEAWGVFATRQPIAHKAVSAYDVSSLFPLTLQADSGALNLSGSNQPNLSQGFLRALANTLGMLQQGAHGLPSGLTVEDIFHYIYAVFHSLSYRSRYAQFLKIDFPRLPLTGNLELFRSLAQLGGELTALHLLESPKLNAPITEFIGSNTVVSKVGWTADDGGTVWIDKGQTNGFRPVPEEVWNFHIGGYQVCEKWLKDRGPKKGQPGRTLTVEDIAHYHKIVIALSETIRLMAEIDQVIETHGGWPGAFTN